MRIPSILLVASLLVASLAPGTSLAQERDAGSSTTQHKSAEVEIPSKARTLLAAIDIILTPERLARAGVTEPVCEAILDEEGASRYLRARTLGALGILGGDSARATLESHARRDADIEIRIQAVISLARAFGPSDPKGVRTFLENLRPSAPEKLDTMIVSELARLQKTARQQSAEVK